MPNLISVIVTTYNWSEALKASLDSLFCQHDNQFEIIIADDGSSPEHRYTIQKLINNSPVPCQHIWHDDLGFRAATIRNKAVAASHGNYLIFLDGDCVVLPHFISRHRQLAEHRYFVPGNRILLNQAFTTAVLNQGLKLHKQSLAFFLAQRMKGQINRLLPFIYWPFHGWRYRKPNQWQKAMTCNLGVWKDDFVTVNGFDECYEGWGYEDSDLIIRLIHQGIKRKEGRFATAVLHLWHPQNDRSQHDENYQRLLARVADQHCIVASKGLNQYR